MAREPTYEELEKRVKDLDKKLEEAGYKQLWNAYSQSPIPTLILSQEGKIVDYNDAMAELTGFVHEEVPHIDAWIAKIYPDEEYRNKVLEISKKSRHREINVKRDEFIITTKAGERRHIEVSVFDISYEGKPTCMQVVQGEDITERKKAEQLLQEANNELERRIEEKTHELIKANEQLKEKIDEHKKTNNLLKIAKGELQIIFDSVPAFIFYKDLNNQIVYANKRWLQLFGMPEDDVIDKSLFEFLPKEQAEGFFKDDMEVIASGQSVRNIFEVIDTVRGIRKFLTDKIPYRDEEGNIAGVIGFAQDITNLKLVENELSESEKRYHSLFNAIDEGFCIIEVIFDENEKPIDYLFIELIRRSRKKRDSSMRKERECVNFPRSTKIIVLKFTGKSL